MSQQVVLEGKVIVHKGKIVHSSIPYQIYRYQGDVEGGPYVANCLPLRLASHGKTRAEAMLSMNNMIRAFLAELVAMGTLDAFLSQRGWTKKTVSLPRRSRRPRSAGSPRGAVAWIPPQVISQMASASIAR